MQGRIGRVQGTLQSYIKCAILIIDISPDTSCHRRNIVNTSFHTSLYVIHFLGSTTLPAAVQICILTSNNQLSMCLWTPVSQLSIEITSAKTVFETKYFNFLLISIIHLWKTTE